MAVKGTESKTIIFTKLQEVFPNSFWEDENKILRIPLDENGAKVEIKVTLTAAKNLLGDSTLESAFNKEVINNTNAPEETKSIEPTEEEKENVAKLIASLGL